MLSPTASRLIQFHLVCSRLFEIMAPFPQELSRSHELGLESDATVLRLYTMVLGSGHQESSMITALCLRA